MAHSTTINLAACASNRFVPIISTIGIDINRTLQCHPYCSYRSIVVSSMAAILEQVQDILDLILDSDLATPDTLFVAIL
jgi:hypothetical protein